MKSKKKTTLLILTFLLVYSMIPFSFAVNAEEVPSSPAIIHDEVNKVVEVFNDQLSLTLDYDHQLRVSSLKLGGEVEVIDRSQAVVSSILPVDDQALLTASYTNSGDNLAHVNDTIISFTEEPRNRWTNYRTNRQPVDSDWIAFQFLQNMDIDSLQLYLFSDSGYVAPPASYQVEYWDGSNFIEVEEAVANPEIPAGNILNTLTFKPVNTDRIRIILKNRAPGEGKTAYYTGVTEMSWLYQNKPLGKGVEWSGTDNLEQSPTVHIEGNSITFDEIRYYAENVPIEEKWIMEVLPNDVKLQIQRTYGGPMKLADQKTLSFSFEHDAFDVIQRTEDGGSFQLLDPGVNEAGETRSLNRFLSNTPYTTDRSANPEGSNVIKTGSWYSNDRYSFYTANMDFIDKLHGQMLRIELSSNRNRATKIWRAPLDQGGALFVEHKLSDQPLSLGGNTGSFKGILGAERYLPLGIFQKNDFMPVEVELGQTDIAEYSFKVDHSLEKYYDIGSIPDTANIDVKVLAQYIQDYGRSSVIDLNVGMGDTDVSGMGPYETWWYSRNALALQGAGNEQYLETLKNFVRFNKDYNFPIHNSGQLYAVSAREAVWYKDFFFDTYGQFIAGIAAIYDISADNDWLLEVKDMARKVLDWAAFTRDINNDGLMESFSYEVTQWDDHSKVGQNSAYANAFLYKALIDWAELEEKVLLDQSRADKYKEKAAQLKEKYNKPIEEGGFWSEETSSYVHSRGLQGEVYGDVAHDFENTYTIMFGIADQERAEQILAQYTDFRNGNNIYEEQLKLFPAQRYAYNKSENNSVFPSYLHGSSFPQMTYDMMAAYAAIGNYEIPEELLRTVVEQYDKDGLIWNTYTWGLEPDTLREPWMSANVRPAAGFYDIIMGIKPKYDRLVIDPALTENMYGASVNYTLRGQKYQITHVNNFERKITTEVAAPIESIWRGLEAGKEYVVIDTNMATGIETKTKSTAQDGLLSYSAMLNGEHYLSVAPVDTDKEPEPGTGSGTNPGMSEDNNGVDTGTIELKWNGKDAPIGKTVDKGNGKLVATIDQDKLAKILEAVQDTSKLQVLQATITGEQRSVVLELDEHIISLLTKYNVQLELQTINGKYTMSSELLLQLAGDNRSIQLGISLVNDQESQQIVEHVVRTGYTKISNPLQFTIIGIEGGKAFDLSHYGQFVQHSFILKEIPASNLKSFVTAMKVNRDGTLSPRLTKLVKNGSGGIEAVFSSSDSGVFILVQNLVSFKDVKGHWAQQSINELGSRMILQGINGELFHPDRAITRAEFATVLVRGLGLEQREDQGQFARFSDVIDAKWYNNAVQVAVQFGLIQGFEDGTFRPDQVITREQAIVMLTRAMKLTSVGKATDVSNQEISDSLQGFRDSDSVSDWAKAEMAFAIKQGLITGKSDGKLASNVQITRAEVAEVMIRALKLTGLI